MSAHPQAHAGSSPCGHPHAHLPPLPGPLHTNIACTHTHTHTRQEPRSRRDLGRVGGALGSAAVAPSSSHHLQALGRHPKNGVVQLGRKLQKKNRKLETNPNPRTEGQPQIHSTSSRPPNTASCPAAPVRVGGQAVVLPCGGGPPPPVHWGGGLEHPLGVKPDLSLLFRWLAQPRHPGAPA